MISVVIPTFNEKKNIRPILKKLFKLNIISEIIFVDDNSEDGTFSEIKKHFNKKKIKGFQRKKNKDLSKSVIFGVKKAKEESILVMDCDLQHDTNYISKMWKKFKKKDTDIIIASRFEKKSYYGNLGLLRSVFSKFAIFIINVSFGQKTSDPLSGFFLCRKELITRYNKNFFSKGYKILFDILYNGKINISIIDFGITFKKRKFEKSKFNLRIIGLFFCQILYTKLLVKK
tara:strand:- start:68 stop:757 length:690 start_codon:yes stop_codon:yes gene_type:complete